FGPFGPISQRVALSTDARRSFDGDCRVRCIHSDFRCLCLYPTQKTPRERRGDGTFGQKSFQASIVCPRTLGSWGNARGLLRQTWRPPSPNGPKRSPHSPPLS